MLSLLGSISPKLPHTPMDRSEIEKDRPQHASSDSVFVHIIDEMPLRVVFAVIFVAFFFVWGGVNNLIRLTGRNVDSFTAPIGIYAGLVAAIIVPIVIWRIKHRAR